MVWLLRCLCVLTLVSSGCDGAEEDPLVAGDNPAPQSSGVDTSGASAAPGDGSDMGQPNAGMGAGTDASGGGGATAAADFMATVDDFECILGWEQVNLMRVTNRLGATDEALAVARSAVPGMRYPVGTIIQLIPQEAMVKRGEGFSPETNDWEFLLLQTSPDGTTISERGTTEIANPLVGNCVDCHSDAAQEWDFVCQKGRACAPLSFSDAVLTNLQNTDPRCQ